MLTTIQQIGIGLIIGLLASILMLLYAVYQPQCHAKKNKSKGWRPLTEEEINDLFDAVDPINPQKKQVFSDN